MDGIRGYRKAGRGGCYILKAGVLTSSTLVVYAANVARGASRCC